MIVALILQLRRSRCLVSRLTDSETKLSHRLAALDAASEGVAVLDAEGCFTYANRTHAQLYGFETGAALEGLSWRDLYQPGEADKLQEIARAAIRETGGWSGEAVGRRTDGGGFDQWVSLAGLPDGGLLCVVTDITQAKAAATERERLTGQLHQARKLEAIGSLAGGIAHDFNNILASILGHAHLLNDLLPVDGEAHALLDRIQVGGERAVALVSQILAFSRRDGEERGDVRLALVVVETVGLLRAVLPSTITLECTGTQSGALVHANASQLGQVLMNLCVNARDAIGSGHGRIMVSLEQIETNGEFADDLDAHGTVVEGIGTVRMEAGRTGGTRLCQAGRERNRAWPIGYFRYCSVGRRRPYSAEPLRRRDPVRNLPAGPGTCADSAPAGAKTGSARRPCAGAGGR
jgi:PAS domain S-box-containing protein